MPYMIKCWIPVDADEPEVYGSLLKAGKDYDQVADMQPENHYEIVECDKQGVEI